MRKKGLRISSLFYIQPRKAEGSKHMTTEVKTTRNLNVIEQSGYRYQDRIKKQLTKMCRKQYKANESILN